MNCRAAPRSFRIRRPLGLLGGGLTPSTGLGKAKPLLPGRPPTESILQSPSPLRPLRPTFTAAATNLPPRASRFDDRSKVHSLYRMATGIPQAKPPCHDGRPPIFRWNQWRCTRFADGTRAATFVPWCDGLCEPLRNETLRPRFPAPEPSLVGIRSHSLRLPGPPWHRLTPTLCMIFRAPRTPPSLALLQTVCKNECNYAA